jgi:hypothetical protein
MRLKSNVTWAYSRPMGPHPSHWPMDQIVLGLSLTTVEKDPRLLVLALTYYVRAKLVTNKLHVN